MRDWLRRHGVEFLLALATCGVALLLRLTLLEFKSGDYFEYTKRWYAILQTEGFSAFGRGFANYNLPYLYLLYGVARFFPDLPPVMAIKIPAMAADFVSAGLIAAIVHLRSRSSAAPLIAGLAWLFAPTAVLNSAFWGQADAVYTCALLASLLCILRRRDDGAMIFFGLALALKAQALFVLPLIAALILRREVRWTTLAWIPSVFVLTLIPALVAGRPFLDTLMIYPAQAAQYEQLTMHAPSVLAWFPDSGRYYPYLYPLSLIIALAGCLGLVWGLSRVSIPLTPGLVIELALVSAILVPFLLPKMHERYFYLADMLSVVLPFFVPALFFVPVVIVTISFFAYQPALFGAQPVPMEFLAVGTLLMLIALLRHVIPQLLRTPTEAYPK